jgi:hypothetical protein
MRRLDGGGRADPGRSGQTAWAKAGPRWRTKFGCLELPQMLRNALIEDLLSEGHARALLGVTDRFQQEEDGQAGRAREIDCSRSEKPPPQERRRPPPGGRFATHAQPPRRDRRPRQKQGVGPPGILLPRRSRHPRGATQKPPARLMTVRPWGAGLCLLALACAAPAPKPATKFSLGRPPAPPAKTAPVPPKAAAPKPVRVEPPAPPAPPAPVAPLPTDPPFAARRPGQPGRLPLFRQRRFRRRLERGLPHLLGDPIAARARGFLDAGFRRGQVGRGQNRHVARPPGLGPGAHRRGNSRGRGAATVLAREPPPFVGPGRRPPPGRAPDLPARRGRRGPLGVDGNSRHRRVHEFAQLRRAVFARRNG